MNDPKLESAGQVIRLLRKERGFGLNEFAAKLGWDKGRLSKYETNQLGINQAAIEQIAKGLGLHPTVLLFECQKHVHPALRNPNSEARKLYDQLIEELAKPK